MQTADLPRTIHRYRLLSEIGQGAMGRVFLAEDPNIGRKIALKVLAPKRICDPDGEDNLRSRFLREARVAGRLNHPGIVTVYDADVDPASGAPYLAMEWVPGRSLRALLADGGPLPLDVAISYVAQVAEALDYAHRRDVVHRDVKPGNLLVTDDGTVKVVDFGIAKLVSASMTVPGSVFGTPYYMAPEQLEADVVDGRTDLFALGGVLYQCVTGRLAFGGESLANIQYKILSVDPRPPEIYNSEIRPALRQVIDRALTKSPGGRFQTGADFAAALAAAAEDLRAGDATRPVAVAAPPSTLLPAAEPRPPAPDGTVFLPSGDRPREPEDLPQEVLEETSGAPPPEAAPPALAQPEPVGAVPEVTSVTRPIALAEAVRRARRWPILHWSFAARWLRLALLAAATTLLVIQLKRLPPGFDVRQAGKDAAELVAQRTEPARKAARESWDRWLGRSPRQERSGAEAPRLQTATLEIFFRHRLAAGFLNVWVDGKLMMSESLEPGLAGFLFGETLEREIYVRPGRRRVEVQVSGLSLQVDVRRTMWGDFVAGGRQRLVVTLGRGFREVDAELVRWPE